MLIIRNHKANSDYIDRIKLIAFGARLNFRRSMLRFAEECGAYTGDFSNRIVADRTTVSALITPLYTFIHLYRTIVAQQC